MFICYQNSKQVSLKLLNCSIIIIVIKVCDSFIEINSNQVSILFKCKIDHFTTLEQKYKTESQKLDFYLMKLFR